MISEMLEKIRIQLDIINTNTSIPAAASSLTDLPHCWYNGHEVHCGRQYYVYIWAITDCAARVIKYLIVALIMTVNYRSRQIKCHNK